MPKNLKEIGEGAFGECISLSKIVIPEGITSLGREKEKDNPAMGIFQYCTNLSEVVLPDSLEMIGNNTFLGCSNLNNIDMPNSIKKIEDGAFAESGLETIKLPEGITKLSPRTFAECKNLTQVSLPASLSEIKHAAFSKCTNLKKIVIPEGVETGRRREYGRGVFYQCKNLFQMLHYRKHYNS